MTKKKKERSFKIPHLLYIMLGLLIIMTLLTYVIPAGEFGLDADGNVNANNFQYLGEQTPVSLWDLLFMIQQGLVGAGVTVWVVMISGANMNVVLETGAIDDFLSYATAKLQKSSVNVLVPVLYFLIFFIAAFAGTDALLAVVPIGVVFAKTLRLDPLSALATTFFPSMIGFGLGPTLKVVVPQVMFGLPPLSGFGVRFILLIIFGLVGLYFTMSYVKKVATDPNNSDMGDDQWIKELEIIEDGPISENPKFPTRALFVLALMVLQYIILVGYSFVGDNIMGFITGFFIVTAIIIGAVGGMNPDQIGDSFARGIASMAFVTFIIGLASTMQMVMTEGNILDTIVYVITRPLMNLDRGLAAVGITAVITLINPLVPSATAKAAVLIPIVQPLANALGIHDQIANQAFLFGDAFTNMISPALGWTMGAIALAGVDYDKWVKWVTKPMVIFILMAFIAIYILQSIGWTGL